MGGGGGTVMYIGGLPYRNQVQKLVQTNLIHFQLKL